MFRKRDMLSVGYGMTWCFVMVYQKYAEKALEPFVLSLHMNLLLLGTCMHIYLYQLKNILMIYNNNRQSSSNEYTYMYKRAEKNVHITRAKEKSKSFIW